MIAQRSLRLNPTRSHDNRKACVRCSKGARRSKGVRSYTRNTTRKMAPHRRFPSTITFVSLPEPSRRSPTRSSCRRSSPTRPTPKHHHLHYYRHHPCRRQRHCCHRRLVPLDAGAETIGREPRCWRRRRCSRRSRERRTEKCPPAPTRTPEKCGNGAQRTDLGEVRGAYHAYQHDNTCLSARTCTALETHTYLLDALEILEHPECFSARAGPLRQKSAVWGVDGSGQVPSASGASYLSCEDAQRRRKRKRQEWRVQKTDSTGRRRETSKVFATTKSGLGCRWAMTPGRVRDGGRG